MFGKSLALTAGIVSLLFSLATHGEQKQTLGEWDVHYMVVNTTFLTPDVASANGIIRSKFNALVNISVLDHSSKAAQDVSVSGSATNLLGTKKPLSFKQVKEGDAIYYLAVLSYRHMETYRFAIEVSHGNETQTLTFSQKLYVDD